METMYDKLGDLLNETLEEGSVKFVRLKHAPSGEHAPEKTTAHRTPPKFFSAESIAESEAESKASGGSSHEGLHTPHEEKSSQKKKSRVERIYPSAAERHAYRRITPEVERAYRLLGVTVSASAEDVKKAYKEKLKYYHPDRYAGNIVLSKIATDKTREIVAAYTFVIAFLGEA